MKKKLSVYFLTAVFLVFGLILPGFAQQQSMNIAVVDFQKASESSIEGKKALSQLKQREQTILKELDKIDRQILSMETKLTAQKLARSLEKQQQLAIDLDTLKVKRKRVEEDSVKDYRKLQFRLTSRIRNEVINVVHSLAKEKQFSLVLDTSSNAVVYFDQTFDITAEVIKRYDSSGSPVSL